MLNAKVFLCILYVNDGFLDTPGFFFLGSKKKGCFYFEERYEIK